MAQAAAPARRGWRSTLWGELSAEFLGTFVLIAFGDGVVAMAVAALNQSGRAENGHTIFLASGDWLLITWGWAMAVVFGVYVAGGISGAHINPAVTLALAAKRDFPWRKVIPYIVAQVVGAFVGAALVYLVYHNAIASFEQANNITRGTPASNTTFSIFATFPAPYFHGNMVGPLIDQIVGTMFLVMFVFALTDDRNQPPLSNLAPFLVGMAVAAIGMSYGANAGYAINPARDFGPRIFAWLAGWGQVAMPGTVKGSFSNYFWVPIVGPLVGGVIGAYVYDFFIRDVLLSRGQPPTPAVEPKGETDVDRRGAGDDREAEPRGRTTRE
ncbi:MAG: aquaporin family protein [Rubrobacteraceae bacterium]|uniref:MIP/aquaporin family protein n=1 Tax=Rubrobacter naiadicus TaxID=1392641 RepID=UPI002360A939|nr:MIP/aquaporin family protein [Rubrobacter naiadicus]MBX6763060.1 aquaporin family protein [Rubrobacteraceae bacterium]MCL6438239.1 aquaporin family protein [Rubrobacteraceae bacterium]